MFKLNFEESYCSNQIFRFQENICVSFVQILCRNIIMFTARGDEIDQIVGLELGADDYCSRRLKRL
jgi:hypothetical protein